MGAAVPVKGQWPVDPQDDQPIEDDRIWIDGCFDFFHHGHAGVMLQARQLGQELWIGIHSDEDILEHKGPTVMNLAERVSAAEACRWSTRVVPHAPYVTELDWISHYGCRFVVHGDDITSDSSGEDCYRFAKRAGRFKVVKRTPGISTTDLVGRMLLCTKDHFIRSLKDALEGGEGPGSDVERRDRASELRQRIQAYASDATGLAPGVDVYMYNESSTSQPFQLFVAGKGHKADQRIVYVDGGFDLFSSGHIEFLRSVDKLERDKANKTQNSRGSPKSSSFVIAGIHNDNVINQEKGLNYPIMNIAERGLCLLQCRYVDAVIFGAPFEPSEAFLRCLPTGIPTAVYHGPTAFMSLGYDPYKDAKRLGIFEEIARHDFQDVDAGHIVNRITASRARFEARQRAKGVKAVGEEETRRKELEAQG